MSKISVAVIFGVGGVIAGLLIAKAYARDQWKGAIGEALTKVGLGGGAVEAIADRVILPSVS